MTLLLLVVLNRFCVSILFLDVLHYKDIEPNYRRNRRSNTGLKVTKTKQQL